MHSDRSDIDSESTLPDDASSRSDPNPITPLPKQQLFIIIFIQVAEPVTSTVVYPFVNQLIRQLGITNGDEMKTGYYVGIIESIFYAAEALTVLYWGRASDRIGRRPVLLGGMLGLTLAMMGFGVSKTYWLLILSRCAQGAFNGNIGVTKSVMAEITDATNAAQAFSFLPVAWSIGSTLGPFIGGVFANPVERWPEQLGSNVFLRAYPYFLPCVISALVPILAFAFAAIGLKETLPSIVESQSQATQVDDECTDTSGLLRSGEAQSPSFYGSTYEALAESHSSSSCQSAAKRPRPPPPRLRALFIRRIIIPILNFAFLAFIDQAMIVLIPLMYSTPIAYGGLGFNPPAIGAILGIWGVCNGLVQVLAFAKIRSLVHHRNLYMIGLLGLLLAFVAFPVMSGFAREAGRADGRVWAVLVLQLTLYMFSYMSYGCMFMYIADAAPSRDTLGATNGLAQLTASSMRAFAPSTASSLFSLSLESGIAGGNLVYWILGFVTATSLLLASRLPKHLA